MSAVFDSEQYWENRYSHNKDSGEGSYGACARYKAAFLNTFIKKQRINTVIELGCGDGAQLDLFHYPQYIGVDISSTALSVCRKSFEEDFTKCFIEYNLLWDNPLQDLALSLDVIFHLVEDNIFYNYMDDLFKISHNYVIIYSSNHDEKVVPHVRHRCFTDWIDIYARQWQRVEIDDAIPDDVAAQTASRFHVFKNRGEMV